MLADGLRDAVYRATLHIYERILAVGQRVKNGACDNGFKVGYFS